MDPHELDDAALLDALGAAQRNVIATDSATGGHVAWQHIVVLMRELERRYPPASLPQDAARGSEDRVASRAELLPEELAVGGENALGLAEAVLADSEERSADRDAASDSFVEHRTSAEATAPPEVSGR
jgi:hypothetical protein